MSPTLSYDAFPPDTDLSREFTTDGVRIVAGAANKPSARAVRWARRMGAVRAILDCIIVTAIAFALTLLLPSGAWRSRDLPRVVYPICAVFVGAIYLHAWKFRTDIFIEALLEARRQVTILDATPFELRIEIDGPHGASSHRIASQDLLSIEPSTVAFKHWWQPDQHMLRFALRDGRIITALPGRDPTELHVVAAILRRILAVPERVITLAQIP